MNQTKQILLAFLIPFGMSVGLVFFKKYYFTHGCVSSPEMPGYITCDAVSIFEMVIISLIVGLFFTSLILPPFLTKRSYQSKRNSLKTSLIIE
jgi:hypothetical protein